jgi:hypothetical protein
MKKLALILAIMLAIPCTAFGLEMLNDNTLDEVTGQSGVSIAFDDVQMFLHVDKFAYIDCDGYGTNSNYGGTDESTIGAGFVINNFQMDVINVNMIGFAGTGAMLLEGDGIDSTGTAIALGVATKLDLPLDLYDNGAGSWTNYGLSFADNDSGTVFFRNPGNQTGYQANATGLNNLSGYSFSDGAFVAGNVTDDGTYTGALALSSTTAGNIPLFYNYANADTTDVCTLDGTAPGRLGLNNYTNTSDVESNSQFRPQALTIDITGALPLFSTGLVAIDPGTDRTIAGVLIGLPTAEIHIQELLIGEMTITADISSNTATEQALVKNNNESFGAIQIEGVTFTILGGWMEIAPNKF